MTDGSISQAIETFLGFLRQCEQSYHMAEADEQEANDETQDILHCLELREHSDEEFLALSKELRETRQKRRTAKDVMNTTQPVLDWLDENRPTVKSMERLLGEVRKAEKNIEGRFYTPKAVHRKEAST